MNKKIIGILICMLLIATAVPAVVSLKNNTINATVPSPPLTSMTANWTEMQKLLTSDSAEWSYFGMSVSVDGDTALIGAPTEYETGTGSAYVFTRTGTTWAQQAKLLASDGAINDYFGVSVSLAGDTALIGACGDDYNGGGSGSAYVFIRTGTIWTQQQKLLALDGAAGDRFGISVSLDGVYALIGADGGDNNQYFTGAAYVYKRDSTHWTQEAKLLASDGTVDDNFGTSVSLDGDYALIGTVADDDQGSDSGSAYVFKRDGTNWVQEAKLLASDGAGDDNFGRCVSLDGEYAIISAPTDSDNGAWSGSVYVFTRTGTAWSQQAKLLASDGGANDRFGTSVSVDGDTALIGAWFDDDNGYDSGSAYVFTRTGTTWTQQKKFLAFDGAAGDWFGFAVSLDSDTALIGAYGDDDNGADYGSAYVFIKESENQSPNTPNNPSPTNNATNISVNTFLQWTGGDPDTHDNVTYDVYLGSTLPLSKVSDNQSRPWYKTYALSYNITYYWKIAAWDNHGLSAEGPIWNFTTCVPPINHPPNTPSNPSPPNQATGVDIDAALSWTGGDPDAGDFVFYDVYFGSMPPLEKIASNITVKSYNPGPLAYSLTYFWKVVAWDIHGLSTVGPGWYFTTISNSPPNKPITPVGVTHGKINVEYTYTSNTTDPEGDQVYYLWDWGDGNNSGWLGPYNSGVTAGVTHNWTVKGSYSIKVKAKDIHGKESNWSDPLPITMPYIFKPIWQQFFDCLFERFPNAFPLLRQLMRGIKNPHLFLLFN